MTSSRRPSASRTRVWMRDTSKALAVLMANVRRTRDQKPQAEVRREIAGPTRHGRARPGHSLACTVIPGRCDSIEPGISRFRVRLFEAPRNDGGEIGRDYPEPVVMQSHRHDFPIPRRVSPELCFIHYPLLRQRAQGRPGGRCTRGSRAKVGLRRRENHRYRRIHSDLPCAVVLRLIRDLPGEPCRLPPGTPTPNASPPRVSRYASPKIEAG